MKRTSIVSNRLLIALALATQLLLLAPPAEAARRDTGSSTVAQDNTNHAGHDSAMRRSGRSSSNRRCRERCLRQYRQCQRGVANPSQARCRQRYNQCLRRCRR